MPLPLACQSLCLVARCSRRTHLPRLRAVAPSSPTAPCMGLLDRKTCGYALAAVAAEMGGGARVKKACTCKEHLSAFSGRHLVLFSLHILNVSVGAQNTATCRVFETFSFLPPLSETEISNQVEYIIANGWTTCLEFTSAENAFIKDKSNVRFCRGGSSTVTSFHSCDFFCESSPPLRSTRAWVLLCHPIAISTHL